MQRVHFLFGFQAAFASIIIVACTGDDTAGTHGPNDGGTDASAPDASEDAGIVCDPDSGEGYAAPHRIVPPLPPPGFATDVVSPVTLITVTAQNETLASDLHGFSDALMKSNWFKTVGAAYGLQPPTASLHVQNSPAITTPMTTTTQVATYLSGVVAANGPQPDGNLLYVLYMPPGASLGGANGFHGSMSRADASLRGDFAVVSRLPFQIFGETELDTLTIAASHEIMEAVTNFNGFGLQWGPAPTSSPWNASIFDFAQLPDEVADVCTGTRTFESTGPDAGYFYQRIFDDRVARCGGGNSCVPREDGPYYNVSIDQDWYPANPGETITIPFHGWSTGPIDDWRVFSLVATGQPQCGGAACPSLTLATAIDRGTLPCVDADGGTDGVVAINNGVEGTLTVTMPSSAESGNYFIVPIFSLLGRAGDRGCDTAPAHDYYHEWPVGVYVP